jgi:protein tyrosine phosphatase (PTP) superfamily phosphohydrolase (DUF442 family)
MTALKTEGVDILVCALTQPELAETGLTEEAHAAREAGLQFTPIPIPDRGVPDLPTVLPTLQLLAAQLRDDAHIVTHCRFGIGRASLLAAALMILNGVTPNTAWQHLEQARGLLVPDTPAQKQWTLDLLDHPLQGPLPQQVDFDYLDTLGDHDWLPRRRVASG